MLADDLFLDDSDSYLDDIYLEIVRSSPLHQPLLPNPLAQIISSISIATRLCLRFSAQVFNTLSSSLQFSTSATFKLSRSALVTATSSARTIQLLALGSDAAGSDPFYRVLDDFTNRGLYAINSVFTLAELLTLASFHLSTTFTLTSLDLAEEAVHVFDGLFGATETSKALAAVISIFMTELHGQDDDLGLSKRFGKITALARMSKSVTAYCCLQYLNREKWRSLVVLDPIFSQRVLKTKTYDPDKEVKALDMFNTNSSSPVTENEVGEISRKLKFTRSCEDVRVVRVLRNRCRSGPSGLLSVPFSTTQSSPVEHIVPTLIRGPSSVISETTTLNIDPVEEKKNEQKRVIKEGARFVKFAVAAYGSRFLKIMGLSKSPLNHSTNHHSLASHTNVPIQHILSSSYSSPLPATSFESPKLLAPLHYLVIDEQTASVVVSLRGTLGLSDIVTDLTASYESYTYSNISGSVHSGILSSAKLISESTILDSVSTALLAHPTYKLVLTGHSLGGGCAALLATLWSKEVANSKFVTNTDIGLPLRDIHCYVYASPAIMSSNLSRALYNLITTFIYRHDVVPCLSLGLLRDFRNITVTFSEEVGAAESVISNVMGLFKDQSQERDADWYWAMHKTLKADMKSHKLFVGGRVFWINSSDGIHNEGTQLHHEDDEMAGLSIAEVEDIELATSEIVFSTSMFTDHSPHHYESSLELLMEQDDFVSFT